MEFTKDVEKWHHKHRVVLYDYGRIALGCFLLFKGVQFLFNITALEQILLESKLYSLSTFLAYTIASIHVVGGLMIMVGWHTRIACLVQIPIVMCAVLFFSPTHDLFSLYSPFAVALYTLLFLAFYLVGGSGYYSFDHKQMVERKHLLKRHKSQTLKARLMREDRGVNTGLPQM
ncbi:DoxX family protein [Rufibacter glacialis]|uniref:DoxX family protein n=1 Tax=Rufibacter glacialis TaxID=1259555 RepID=A0A5M8QK07_9BACT|nr:DoxX family protein [Rufibacter glacialis]KAA6434642.1 DoxX family protein [Rufibacter glacialis]